MPKKILLFCWNKVIAFAAQKLHFFGKKTFECNCLNANESFTKDLIKAKNPLNNWAVVVKWNMFACGKSWHFNLICWWLLLSCDSTPKFHLKAQKCFISSDICLIRLWRKETWTGAGLVFSTWFGLPPLSHNLIVYWTIRVMLLSDVFSLFFFPPPKQPKILD